MNEQQAETTRFSLRFLIVWTAFLCAIFAGLAASPKSYWLPLAGLIVAPMIILAWWRAYIAIGVLTVVWFFVACIPSISSTRPSSERSACEIHLRQLSLALLNYHETYGSFPPAYVADAQGRPMHSWRVLILPFIEEESLYKQYRFDEPWNGPNNSKLADQVGDVELFRCWSDKKDRPLGMTNYLAVVGPQTMWPGSEGRRIREVSDGLTRTILLVEVAQSGIHWMEPRDLHVTQMAPTINSNMGQGISSNHHQGFNAVFGDGSNLFLTEQIPANELWKLLTVDGQEEVDPEQFRQPVTYDD